MKASLKENRVTQQDAFGPPQKAPVIMAMTAVYGYLGGIEKFNQRLIASYARCFPDRRLSVIVLEDDDTANPLESERIIFKKLKTRPRLFGKIRFVGAILALILQERPNEVFVGHIALCFPVLLLSKIFGFRYSVIAHGIEVEGNLGWFRSIGLKHASRIMGVSHSTLLNVGQQKLLRGTQLTLLPNTCDETFFSPAPRSPTLVRRHGLENQKVLLTVGRLVSGEVNKGIDTTIRALPEVMKAFPVKYFIVGGGNGRSILESLVQSLQLQQVVVFVGKVSDIELVEFYRLADCYVMPSKEGFGIAYLEALLCGVPVISSNNDGSGEPVQNGKLGWRVEPRDPAAVASAIKEILLGKDQRCQKEFLRSETIRKFGLRCFDEKVRELFKDT